VVGQIRIPNSLVIAEFKRLWTGNNRMLIPEFDKSDATKLCVGMMYCGDYNEVNKDYVYVAYNFYSSREKLALPKLKKGMKWYKVCDSEITGCSSLNLISLVKNLMFSLLLCSFDQFTQPVGLS